MNTQKLLLRSWPDRTFSRGLAWSQGRSDARGRDVPVKPSCKTNRKCQRVQSGHRGGCRSGRVIDTRQGPITESPAWCWKTEMTLCCLQAKGNKVGHGKIRHIQTKLSLVEGFKLASLKTSLLHERANDQRRLQTVYLNDGFVERYWFCKPCAVCTKGSKGLQLQQKDNADFNLNFGTKRVPDADILGCAQASERPSHRVIEEVIMPRRGLKVARKTSEVSSELSFILTRECFLLLNI